MFHLHGHDRIVDSLVLTEDDYVDFTVNVSQRRDLIPTVVQDAITDNTLVFLGYSLNDWNFRVLFRTLQGYLENSTKRRPCGRLAPAGDRCAGRAAWLDRAVRFFERYLQNQRIVVYWGSCAEFVDESVSRWWLPPVPERQTDAPINPYLGPRPFDHRRSRPIFRARLRSARADVSNCFAS